MNYLDYTIIISFLSYLILVGLKDLKKNIPFNMYALGSMTLSLRYLIATIVATWISGSMLSLRLSETYTKGFYGVIPATTLSIALFFIAAVIIPRMQEFVRVCTLGQGLENIYGSKYIRVITALLSIFSALAPLSLQFKVMGHISYYFIPEISLTVLTVCFAAFVVTYSCIGGVTAVIRTDLVQIIVGIMATVGVLYFMYTKRIDFQHIDTSLPEYAKYNLVHVLTTYDQNFFDMLALIVYFIIPSIGPTTYQRISMAPTLKFAQTSWFVSAFSVFFISVIMSYLGFCLFHLDQNLDKNSLISYIIEQVTPSGMIGLLLIGFIALSMSTADSFLNVIAVTFANDLQAEKDPIKKANNARYITCGAGVVAVLIASLFQSFLDILQFVYSFYMPAVTMVFIFTIFGFRSTARCVLITMLSTTILVATLTLLRGVDIIDFKPLIPCLLYSVFFYITYHYTVEKWEWFKCFGITSKLKGLEKK